MEPIFEFKNKLWLWSAEKASWHFITVPKKISESIKGFDLGPKKGFGSVRVQVTIGSSTWNTSIFPDKKLGCYVLPVKKDVRIKEKLTQNKEYKVKIRIKL